MLPVTFINTYMKLNKYFFWFILRKNKSYFLIRSFIKKDRARKIQKQFSKWKKSKKKREVKMFAITPYFKCCYVKFKWILYLIICQINSGSEVTPHWDASQATSGPELFGSHKDETNAQIVLKTNKCALIVLMFRCCVLATWVKLKCICFSSTHFMHLINGRNMEHIKLTGQMFVYTLRTDRKQICVYNCDCSLSYTFNIIILKLLCLSAFYIFYNFNFVNIPIRTG